MDTTVGKSLLKSHLPIGMHAFIDSTELDKKGISTLFNTLAEKYPNEYAKVASELARLGFEVSTRLGSTVRLTDLRSPIDKDARFKELDVKLQALRKEEKSDKKYEIKANALYQDFVKGITKELVDVGVTKNQTLAKIIKSGSRGSPVQYMQTVFAPVLVQDNSGRPMVDFPITKSFAEGLTLPEYLATTFGSRQGEVAKKLAVADAGHFSKQLSRATMTLRVEEHDCGTNNGIDVSVDNREVIGTYLAHPVEGYNKNNEVTSRVLSDLHNKGIRTIIVRSPITCQSSRRFHSNAICQLCSGKREKGLPQVGDFIGITSASTLGEPLAQGQLCLHEDTEVRMYDGSTRKIKNLVVGDKILGCSKTGEVSTTTITEKFDQGLQDCNEYEFTFGHTANQLKLTATPTHKILCNVKKWSCRATSLNHQLQVLPLGTVGRDFNAVLPVSYVEDKNFVYAPYALLLGTLLGDGGLTGNNVLLTCADETQIADLNHSLHPLHLKFTKHKYHGGIQYGLSSSVLLLKDSVTVRGHKQRVRVNPAIEYLRVCGVMGKYAHEKTIPEEAYLWNNESIAGLLAGLFVTDGCVFAAKTKTTKTNRRLQVSLGSVSKKLLEQVRFLLAWRFAIYSNLNLACTAGKWNYVHDFYVLQINDQQSLKNFATSIPLFGVKKKRLEKLLELNVENNIGINSFDTKHFRCHRLTNPRSIGKVQCYDIAVDHPDHLFVLANGLVVSNSLKHSSGSATGPNLASGFDLIKQLASIPQNFKDKAAVAEHDGEVSQIRVAPQGGHYLDIGSDEYYIPTGFGIKVKVGAHVEAGEVLSDGIINPADIVRLKGIGEGRRYFAHTMKQAFDESGMGGINHRNFEVLAKSMIDHVQITNNNGLGDHLPGETVSYQAIERDYQPRPDAANMRVDQAYNKYLEQPVLYYTIGTRITKSIIKKLRDNGIENVMVSSHPPGFTPDMQRLDAIPGHEPNWMHQLYTSNLERKILHAANTGAFSDLKGASPIAGLAYGLGFGER